MFGLGRLTAGSDRGSDNECPLMTSVHRRGRGTFHRPDEDRTLHWEHLDTMPLKLTDIKRSPTAVGSEWTKDRVMIGGGGVDMVRSPHAAKKQQKQQCAQRKKRNGKDGEGEAAMGAVARPALSAVASDDPDSTSSKRRRRKKSTKAALDGATEQPQLLLQTPQKLSKAVKPSKLMDVDVVVPAKATILQKKTSSMAVAASSLKTKKCVFSFKQASLSTQQQKQTPSAVMMPELLAPGKLNEAAPKAATPEKVKPLQWMMEAPSKTEKEKRLLEASEVQPSLAAPEPEANAEIRETEVAALAPTLKLAGIFASCKKETETEKMREAEVSALASLNADGFFACKTETTAEKREAAVPTLKDYGIFAPKTETTMDMREAAEPVPATLKHYGIFAPRTETTNDKREAAEPAPTTLKTYGIFAPKTETTTVVREVKPSVAALEKADKATEPVDSKQAELELFGVSTVEPVKPVVTGWAANFLRAMEKAKVIEPAPRAEEALRRVERV